MKKDNKGGFEYYPSFNQKKAKDMCLSGVVNAVDLMIFEMLVKYSSWSGCKKLHECGKTYFYFSWKLVPQRLPFFDIKSRSAVKKRFAKLEAAGFLESHEINRNGQSWFCFGKKHGQYFSFEDLTPKEKQHPSSLKDGATQKETPPVLIEGHPPSSLEDTPRPDIRTPPVLIEGHNECTNMSVLIENTYERGENAPAPFTADAISDYDKQALPTPEFLSSPQSETEKRKKVPAKKEKEKLPLRKIEAAVLDWLRGEGKEDWNYAARGYIGTDSQKEKEVGMCLANMEKKQSYRLQKTAEMPATIISELVMWYGNQYVKARGQNSLTNANSSATGRKTQNNEYLIDAQTAATALQNYRARRGTESGAGYGTD